MLQSRKEKSPTKQKTNKQKTPTNPTTENLIFSLPLSYKPFRNNFAKQKAILDNGTFTIAFAEPKDWKKRKSKDLSNLQCKSIGTC